MHTTSSGLEKNPATAAWRGLAARPPHVDGGGAGQGGDPEETIGEQALIRHVGQRAAAGQRTGAGPHLDQNRCKTKRLTLVSRPSSATLDSALREARQGRAGAGGGR